jgi:hypothetical protein
MSVIVLEPKELATVRNLFHSMFHIGNKEVIDRHLQTLMTANAFEYACRYREDLAKVQPWQIKDLLQYFRVTQTKVDIIDGIESFRSLIYNCDTSTDKEAQTAYRYLSMTLLTWQTGELKAAWGVES